VPAGALGIAQGPVGVGESEMGTGLPVTVADVDGDGQAAVW